MQHDDQRRDTGMHAAGTVGAGLLALLGGLARHADDVGRGVLRHADDVGRGAFHSVDDFGSTTIRGADDALGRIDDVSPNYMRRDVDAFGIHNHAELEQVASDVDLVNPVLRQAAREAIRFAEDRENHDK